MGTGALESSTADVGNGPLMNPLLVGKMVDAVMTGTEDVVLTGITEEAELENVVTDPQLELSTLDEYWNYRWGRSMSVDR